MSTATQKTAHATVATFTVAAGQTVTAYRGVVFATATTIQTAGAASDAVIGIALSSATAGQQVDVFLPNPVVPVTVGAGGATRGTKAVIVANGMFQDAPAHDSSGGTDNAIYGTFMESGASGDVRGLMLTFGNRGSA